MTDTYKRQVSYRVFSDALKSATVVPKGDEEYAVQYTKLSTGHKINRIFVVGTLTNLEDVGTDTAFFRLRISDPKGTFSANIGQYSPAQAQNTIQSMKVPCFVAIVGKVKPREYNENTYFDIAIESINEVDAATYDRWVDETAELTKERQENNV